MSRVSCSPDRRSGRAEAATRCSGPGSASELDAQAREDAGATGLDLLLVAVAHRGAQILVLEVQADAVAEADVRARHALESPAAGLAGEIAAEGRACVAEPD